MVKKYSLQSSHIRSTSKRAGAVALTVLALLLTVSQQSHAENLVLDPTFSGSSLFPWQAHLFQLDGQSHSLDNPLTYSAAAHCRSPSISPDCLNPVTGAFLSQSLKTIPGTKYDISFWVFEKPTSSNDAMEVWWQGSSLSGIVASPGKIGTGYGHWQNYSYQAVAATSSTAFLVSAYNETEAVYFDDFSVTQSVPEPQTYAMLLAGLGVIGCFAGLRSRR
jgi:hypothetical protein